MSTGLENKYVCQESFATIDVFLGFALTIGILISFLPQIIVLIVKKNVEGLSVLSCWFNYANCMCNFMNILYLNWFVFDCCESMTSWTCFKNLLPMVQMLSPFISTLVIFILYTIYRPRLPPMDEYKRQLASQKINNNDDVNISPPQSPNENTSILSGNKESIDQLDLNNSIQVSDTLESVNINQSDSINNDTSIPSSSSSTSSTSSTTSATPLNKSSKNYVKDESLHLKTGGNTVERFFIKMDWYSKPFFWSSILFSVIFFIIGLAIAIELGGKAKSLHAYAFALGILASILVFFQWLPQIYTTWISQEIGSLSLVSLCIQAPGALLVVVFQWKQNWSTWFPYLATAVQAFVLIGICVYFIIRDKKKKKLQDKLKLQQEQVSGKLPEVQEEKSNIEYYQSVEPNNNNNNSE